MIKKNMKGRSLSQMLNFLLIFSLLLDFHNCEIIKLFKSNGRNSGIIVSRNVRSLLKCSVLFEQSPHVLSFNYNKANRICELSNLYPESSTTAFGWKVYSHVVDGVWGNWMNWGSCSVTCGAGTRSRSRLCNNPSPSNGGNPCQGPTIENQSCQDKSCNGFVGGFYKSTDDLTWTGANRACNEVSSTLAILDTKEKMDKLLSVFNGQELNHWIGLKCVFGMECTWLNGRNAKSGYQAWAPGEPSGTFCVWIGHRGHFWDDTGCHEKRRYLCQQT